MVRTSPVAIALALLASACGADGETSLTPDAAVDADVAGDVGADAGAHDTSDGADAAATDPRADQLREDALAAGLLPLTDAEPPARTPLVELGELLFYDPVLSGEQDVACATCHHPSLGMADGRDLPIGVAGVGLGPDRVYPEGADIRPLGELRPLGRHSPTTLNLALLSATAATFGEDTAYTWDGRFVQLSQFAHTPLRTRDEMRGDAFPALEAVGQILARLEETGDYRQRFEAVFSDVALDGITEDHLARTLSAFLQSQTSLPTPYDRFLAGEPAPSDAFLDGLDLFLELGCVSCHNGVALTDLQFHRTGAPPNELSRPFQGGIDIGREEVTARPSDRFRFRTAPLRELAHTAPYMHSGMVETLGDVVDMYTGDENALVAMDPDFGDETLERGDAREVSADERAALVTFLEAISGPEGWVEATYPAPDRVPSGLPPAAIEAE